MPDGFDLQAFLSIDSTNKEAMRKIESGAKSGHWITAEEQLSGRGRGKREWVSKPGNLYCSLIYQTGKSIRHSAELSFVTSLAVRETVAQFITDADIRCKWPNDVLVDGKKISGILLETHTRPTDNETMMIIGTGINVEHHPKNTLYPVTHINENSEMKFCLADIFFILATKMAHWLTVWQEKGFSEIRREWLKYAKGQGEMITVRMGETEIVGRFVDLDAGGALQLDTGTEIKLIHSGDVFFPDMRKEK